MPKGIYRFIQTHSAKHLLSMAIALYAPALSILAEDEDHWTEKHQSQTEIEHLKILTHKNKLSEISGSEKK